jgi:Menin
LAYLIVNVKSLAAENNTDCVFLGKGIEDKRGQPVTDAVAHKSWLYLNGNAVVCTRPMELAAMVSGINPSISSTSESVDLATLLEVTQLLLLNLMSIDHLSLELLLRCAELLQLASGKFNLLLKMVATSGMRVIPVRPWQHLLDCSDQG